MDDSALALAKLINSDGFQRKLNDLIEAQKAAEAVKADADKARREAEATILAMNQLRTQQLADLAKVKADADKAANEAKLRIDLANSVKAALDERAAELDKRLADLEEREKVVGAAHDHFAGALRQLGLTAS